MLHILNFKIKFRQIKGSSPWCFTTEYGSDGDSYAVFCFFTFYHVATTNFNVFS